MQGRKGEFIPHTFIGSPSVCLGYCAPIVPPLLRVSLLSSLEWNMLPKNCFKCLLIILLNRFFCSVLLARQIKAGSVMPRKHLLKKNEILNPKAPLCGLFSSSCASFRMTLVPQGVPRTVVENTLHLSVTRVKKSPCRKSQWFWVLWTLISVLFWKFFHKYRWKRLFSQVYSP